jgi:hypothetical protein
MKAFRIAFELVCRPQRRKHNMHLFEGVFEFASKARGC